MTERQELDWDHAAMRLTDAERTVREILDALPDDLAHHVARNRLMMALGAMDDAGMYVDRARTLTLQIEHDRAGRHPADH